MADLKIIAGPFTFEAKLLRREAPQTCERFLALLPYQESIIHVKWSGEGCWIPLGDRDFGLKFENATAHPAPGDFIFYPGGYSETEILLAYGGVSFSSKLGPLAGNHFMTITQGRENLRALGEMVLWKGAQSILFERAGDEP